MTRLSTSQTLAHVIAKSGLSFGALACFTFLGFSLTFLKIEKVSRWLIPISAFIAGLFVILFWTTPLVLKGVIRFEYGTYMAEAGPFMPLYGVFVLVHMLIPTGLFIIQFRKSSGIVRLQIGYILFAVVIIGVAAFGSLLPTFSSSSLMSLLPMLLSAAAPALIAYAIIRHQLWDIRTVIHKTGLWVVASTLLIVPVFLLLNATSEQLTIGGPNVAFLYSLVLFSVFAFYFKVIQPWIDQRFRRRIHDPIKVLGKFNHEVMNLRGVREYADLVVQTVKTTLYSKPAMVRIIDHGDQAFKDDEQRRVQTGDFWIVGAGERVLQEWLVKHNKAVDLRSVESYDLSPKERKALEGMFRDREVTVLVPFVHEGELLGVLELGEKENLRAYTREDFQLLEAIRSPATVAMANAILYDRLHELMLNLESRVQQRTGELRMANEQLQELDRQKSKFFANITHELKTPLTLILAPLEDLMMSEAAVAFQDDLRVIHRNALRLMRQINGLLDLAKIDAGTMRLKVGEFQLEEQVEIAVRNFNAVARRKDVRLSLKIDGIDHFALGDVEKLDLVWANLLANAVKFTDPGGSIEVSVGQEPNWFTVAVKDTGIGIPSDQLDRIFDRFAQVDSSITRRYEGAGIGLSLVREILKLHGGEISVESELGKGSCFEVRLPRQLPQLPDEIIDRRALDLPTGHSRRAEDRDPVSWVDIAMDGEAWVSIKRPSAESAPGSNGPEIRYNVMVVDDNADLRNYLGQKLSALYKMVLCEDGKQALAAMEEVRPDLVIMDVMMPELSGFDLCRIMRENPLTNEIPIILVTARRGVDRALEGFQVGANDYLTKPFNVRELIARIQIQLKLVEMSRQLVQREKGSVLNLVAAGLAHEVRNPANAILNAVPPLREMIESKDYAGADVEELFTAIQDSATRIEALCSDLLGLSRPDQDEVSEWQIEQTLRSSLRILGYKHGFKPQVSLDLKHSQLVLGHTARLNQVVLNLLDNAMRAVGSEGHIWVTTSQAGQRFRLVVKDDGPGIPKEDRDRVFDPLYSTYFSSGSSGLGLYISSSIVRDHQGIIAVTSAPGEGAEITIDLPLAAGL